MKINLHGTYQTVKSRKLWQGLFNIYRENGGDLSNLDNLLIDYHSCQAVFNQNNLQKFLWSFVPGNYFTNWFNEFDEDDVNQFLRDEEFVVIVTVTQNEILFEFPELT